MHRQARLDAAANYFETNAEIFGAQAKRAYRTKTIVCCLAMEKLAMVGAQLLYKLSLIPTVKNKLINCGRHDPVSKDLATELFDWI